MSIITMRRRRYEVTESAGALGRRKRSKTGTTDDFPLGVCVWDADKEKITANLPPVIIRINILGIP
jgi:hypothetical protein